MRQILQYLPMYSRYYLDESYAPKHTLLLYKIISRRVIILNSLQIAVSDVPNIRHDKAPILELKIKLNSMDKEYIIGVCENIIKNAQMRIGILAYDNNYSFVIGIQSKIH